MTSDFGLETVRDKPTVTTDY